MRFAIAQINSTIGDFSGNARKIIEYSWRAETEHHADIILFPELSVCGYPPMDLLEHESFVNDGLSTIRDLEQNLPPELAVGIGFVDHTHYDRGKNLVNKYGIILDGHLIFEQIKTLLPSYDVFDESRYFEPAREWALFEWKDCRIGFAICEDAWCETEIPGTTYVRNPVQEYLKLGATVLVVPSASPYVVGKSKVRRRIAENISSQGNLPLIYVNAVGANDSLLFDGRSFCVVPDRAGGTVLTRRQADAFVEDMIVWDHPAEDAFESCKAASSSMREKKHHEWDIVEEALVLGIRDYMNKCGFCRCHLGLSGGIDSALVAYLAVKAVGKENVLCFRMPSMFSSQGSLDDAEELATNLGCGLETLPIDGIYTIFLETLADTFQRKPFDVAEENLQSRIRGTLLMAYSNKFGSMLLATGNKSELAMGYCTLYGDMNGALAPIGDFFKTEIYTLCRRINEKSVHRFGENMIPNSILDKPPSAELRPGQTDQDNLPPYDILDGILKLYLYENRSAEEIIEHGYERDWVFKIIYSVSLAEFKRRQAPPVLKASEKAFGLGRRIPIARAIKMPLTPSHVINISTDKKDFDTLQDE